MKSAIPFLIKSTYKVLDKIDRWCEKKIKEREEKENKEKDKND